MRKLEAIANFAMLLPLFLAFVIGFLVVVTSYFVQHPGAIFFVCLSAYGIGLSLLVAAKLSLFRQGILFGFGPSRMSPTNQRRYGAGYTLILIGIVLNLLLLFFTAVRG